MKMKKILFLLLISANSFGQIWGSYSAIANLKNSAQLIPNTVYILSNLGKMQIVAKTVVVDDVLGIMPAYRIP